MIVVVVVGDNNTMIDLVNIDMNINDEEEEEAKQ